MKLFYLYKCHKCNIIKNQHLSYTCAKKLVILTGFHKYKTIIKSLTGLEIEITNMMKRHQHITKLQSELIQEKKLIDHKLDEAIAKHCYIKTLKYELLPQVVITNIPSHMKFRKLDNILNTIQHTVPMTPPNTPSKATLHNIITKHLSVLHQDIGSQELANRRLCTIFIMR